MNFFTKAIPYFGTDLPLKHVPQAKLECCIFQPLPMKGVNITNQPHGSWQLAEKVLPLS
jgi:hypothetical protein